MADHPTTSPLWPADNSAITAHINLLQGIINRLANNSASCKTWCLTLVAAFLSLAGAAHEPRIVTFALIPIVFFGSLDATYLAQERAYRDLYSDVAAKIRKKTYALEEVFEARAPLTFGRIWGAFTSWSIFPVYGVLLLAYAIALWNGWLGALTAAAKP
jgi:hypothetical protein